MTPCVTPCPPLSGQVTGLLACEDYLLLVAVVGPDGTGLPPPIGRVRTQFDMRAPPRNVTVEVRRGLRLMMRVRWSSSCPVVKRPVGYNVSVGGRGAADTAGRTAVEDVKRLVTMGDAGMVSSSPVMCSDLA